MTSNLLEHPVLSHGRKDANKSDNMIWLFIWVLWHINHYGLLLWDPNLHIYGLFRTPYLARAKYSRRYWTLACAQRPREEILTWGPKWESPWEVTQFLCWPGMGLDLCRALHVKWPHSALVGGGSQITIGHSPIFGWLVSLAYANPFLCIFSLQYIYLTLYRVPSFPFVALIRLHISYLMPNPVYTYITQMFVQTNFF